MTSQSAPIKRVSDVLWKPIVGQHVSLRGRIIRSNGNDKYMFADESGDITVVIPGELMGGKPVSEYATVSIEGRVIKDYRSTVEVLVDQLRIEP